MSLKYQITIALNGDTLVIESLNKIREAADKADETITKPKTIKIQTSGAIQQIRDLTLAINGTFDVLRNVQKAFLKLGDLSVVPAAEIEFLKARIISMYGSVEAGTAAFNEFVKISSQIPFTLLDVVNAGAQMKAFGMDAVKYLRQAADLTAYIGEKSLTFGANSWGRAYAGGAGAADILRERGINSKVQEYLGTMDLLNVKLEDYRAALLGVISETEYGIAGATERMQQTAVGQFSNWQDAALKLKASIGDALLPMMKDVMQYLIKVANTWRAFVEEVRGLAEVPTIAAQNKLEEQALKEYGQKSNEVIQQNLDALTGLIQEKIDKLNELQSRLNELKMQLLQTYLPDSKTFGDNGLRTQLNIEIGLLEKEISNTNEAYKAKLAWRNAIMSMVEARNADTEALERQNEATARQAEAARTLAEQEKAAAAQGVKSWDTLQLAAGDLSDTIVANLSKAGDSIEAFVAKLSKAGESIRNINVSMKDSFGIKDNNKGQGGYLFGDDFDVVIINLDTLSRKMADFYQMTIGEAKDMATPIMNYFNVMNSAFNKTLGRWASSITKEMRKTKNELVNIFADILESFVAMLAQMMAKWLALKLVMAAFPGSSFFSALFGSLSSGGITSISSPYTIPQTTLGGYGGGVAGGGTNAFYTSVLMRLASIERTIAANGNVVVQGTMMDDVKVYRAAANGQRLVAAV